MLETGVQSEPGSLGGSGGPFLCSLCPGAPPPPFFHRAPPLPLGWRREHRCEGISLRLNVPPLKEVFPLPAVPLLLGQRSRPP